MYSEGTERAGDQQASASGRLGREVTSRTRTWAKAHHCDSQQGRLFTSWRDSGLGVSQRENDNPMSP